MENRDKIIEQTVARLKAIQTTDQFLAAREELLDLIEKIFKSGLEEMKKFFGDIFPGTPEEEQAKKKEFQDESYMLIPAIEEEMERIVDQLMDEKEEEVFVAELGKRLEPYMEEYMDELGKNMENTMGGMMDGMAEAMGMENVEEKPTGLSDEANKAQKEIQDKLAAQVKEMQDKMDKLKKENNPDS